VSDLPAAPGNAVLATSTAGDIFDATASVDGTELAATLDEGFTLNPGDLVMFKWITRNAS
jgi:hypothetical protein